MSILRTCSAIGPAAGDWVWIPPSTKRSSKSGANWLNGKTALITGATSGVGRELAISILKREVRVIAHGRNPSLMEDLIRDTNGVITETVFGNFEDESGRLNVEKIIKQIKPELLVLNAGFNIGKKKSAYWTDAEIEKMFNVNLITPIHLARTFSSLTPLQESRRLVIILSTSCFFPREHMGLYVATKMGLMGFGRIMQKEMHDLGVRTILIYPGRMNTSFRKDSHPEYTSPPSVAEAIIYLLCLPDDLVPYEFVFRPPGDIDI